MLKSTFKLVRTETIVYTLLTIEWSGTIDFDEYLMFMEDWMTNDEDQIREAFQVRAYHMLLSQEATSPHSTSPKDKNQTIFIFYTFYKF